MDRSNRKDRERPPRKDDDRSKATKNDRRRSRSPSTRDSSKFDRSDRWNDRSRDQKPRDDKRGADRAPAGPRNPPQARGAGPPPNKPASQRDVSPGSRHQRGRGRGQLDGQAKPSNRDTKMEEESKPAFDSIEDTDEAMQRVMGFAAFRSTKNTKVPGNAANYAVYKVEPIEYRQYMNRKGGFNRPLSPGRN